MYDGSRAYTHTSPPPLCLMNKTATAYLLLIHNLIPMEIELSVSLDTSADSTDEEECRWCLLFRRWNNIDPSCLLEWLSSPRLLLLLLLLPPRRRLLRDNLLLDIKDDDDEDNIDDEEEDDRRTDSSASWEVYIRSPAWPNIVLRRWSSIIISFSSTILRSLWMAAASSIFALVVVDWLLAAMKVACSFSDIGSMFWGDVSNRRFLLLVIGVPRSDNGRGSQRWQLLF